MRQVRAVRLWPCAVVVGSGYCVSVRNRYKLAYRDRVGVVVIDAEPMAGSPIGFYLFTSSLTLVPARRGEIEARLRSAFEAAGWNLELM